MNGIIIEGLVIERTNGIASDRGIFVAGTARKKVLERALACVPEGLRAELRKKCGRILERDERVREVASDWVSNPNAENYAVRDAWCELLIIPCEVIS